MRMTVFLLRAALAVALAASLGARAFNHTDTVQPIAPGKFAVACTNIEQDTTLIAPGASASDYWEGRNGHYITDILRHPDAAARVSPQEIEKLGSLGYISVSRGVPPLASKRKATMSQPTTAFSNRNRYESSRPVTR